MPVVMIVCEDEVAAQSKQVDRILKLSGLSRAQFSFATCDEKLFDRIREEKPKAILAFGNTPLELLTGNSGISRFRGYVLDGPQNTKVIPTFHPFFLLPKRGQKSTSHYTPAVIRDIKQAMNVAVNGWQLPPTHYLEDVSVADAHQFYQDYILGSPCPLSIDIETPYKLKASDEEEFEELDTQILRIGYCFRPGYAMSIPFTSEYLEIHKALLTSPWKKVWWNGYHFDIPVIEEVMGIRVNGVQIDAMWAWHHLQPDLPRGLESVGSFYFQGLPWKHLSKDAPAKYNCIDVDCALQNWLGIEAALKKNGQLEGFYELVVDLDPFLKEAGTNGVHIDRAARRKLYKKLRKEENRLLQLIQPLVPPVLKPAKRYKRFPSVHEGKREIREVMAVGKTKMCKGCGVCGVTKAKHTSKKGGKKGIPLNPCYQAEIVELNGEVIEWDVVLDFNPASSKQLIAYLEYFGLPVGRHPKTGAPTVDDDHMEMLIKKHGNEFPILQHIRELRTVSKSISTYVKGLKPNEHGVVQTQYTYAPATGRLSSKGLQRGSDRGVNLQNIPHRGDHPYASEIRKMIIPKKGYVFVEADSSAIEAVMVGYFMGGKDDPYVKMAQRGIHDAFSLYSRGEELTDENIAKFKKLAKVQGSEEMIMRDRKKRTVHAANYDEGPGLIHKTYPKEFPTFLDAKKELAAYHSFVPGLKKWHHATRVQANETHYLQLPFGNYRRYFYNVFDYVRDKEGKLVIDPVTKKPKIKLGEDGKSCIAQRPQGAAAMFMRQNALRIAKEKKGYPFVLPGNFLVHDSYCLEVPDNEWAKALAVQVLKSVLTRPIPEMDNIQIGCDIKIGKNWDDMETVEVVKV